MLAAAVSDEYRHGFGSEAEFSHGPLLAAVKKYVLGEIESKLHEKEESLWKRGQVEIRKLQQEHLHVCAVLQQMQQRQSNLADESKQLSMALVDVSTKFEMVVKDIQEVLHILPRRRASTGTNHIDANSDVAQLVGSAPTVPAALEPDACILTSPSTISTSASQATEEQSGLMSSEPTPSKVIISDVGSGDFGSSYNLATPVMKSIRCDEGVPTVTDARSDYHTPLRVQALSNLRYNDMVQQKDTRASLQEKLGSAPTWGEPVGIPVATSSGSSCPSCQSAALPVLSLASVLPSSTKPASEVPPMSPMVVQNATQSTVQATPLKLVQLAECLGGLAEIQPDSSHVADIAPTPPTQGNEELLQFDIINMKLLKHPGFSQLGIEVDQVDQSTLRIESIDEFGVVGRHNNRQDNDVNKVLVGDRIIEVNGARRNAEQMLIECKMCETVLLTLARLQKTRRHSRHPSNATANSEAGSISSRGAIAAAELDCSRSRKKNSRSRISSGQRRNPKKAGKSTPDLAAGHCNFQKEQTYLVNNLS